MTNSAPRHTSITLALSQAQAVVQPKTPRAPKKAGHLELSSKVANGQGLGTSTGEFNQRMKKLLCPLVSMF